MADSQFQQFVDDMLIKTDNENDTLLMKTLYTEYKTWFNNNYDRTLNCLALREFKGMCLNKFGNGDKIKYYKIML
jgi:hypothetical protein